MELLQVLPRLGLHPLLHGFEQQCHTLYFTVLL